MKELKIAGIISNIEMKTSNSGINYLRFAVEELITKKDGTHQIITNYVSAFNEGVLNAYSKGYYQLGNAVIMEVGEQPEIYNNKIQKNYTTWRITNLNLAQVLEIHNTQQPQATQPAQQVAQQQAYVAQPQVAQQPAAQQGVFQTAPSNVQIAPHNNNNNGSQGW